MTIRQPLDVNAYALMLVLTMLWGLQQVAIKLAAQGVSPVTQAAIRSIVTTALLVGWARWRGVAQTQRDGTLAAGLAAGALFAGEFFFIYFGLGHTTASRMVVFIYLARVLAALGLAWFVPGERLTAAQWAGVLLAFAGVATAFADGFSAPGRDTLLGDACGVIAAALWAATTVQIRATKLAQAAATKTLLYQLAVSALLLPFASVALREPGVVVLGAVTVASLVFQGVVVAFASYLAWFWLLTRYLARIFHEVGPECAAARASKGICRQHGVDPVWIGGPTRVCAAPAGGGGVSRSTASRWRSRPRLPARPWNAGLRSCPRRGSRCSPSSRRCSAWPSAR